MPLDLSRFTREQLEAEVRRLHAAMDNAALAAEMADKDAGEQHARMTVLVEELTAALRACLTQMAGIEAPIPPERMRPAITQARALLAKMGLRA